VFDGLGKELEEKLHNEIGKITKILIAVLVGLMMLLGGIIVEGRVTAGRASAENDRNYKAILDVDAKLDKHVWQTGPREP
jgi:hypothetical protein